MGERVRSCLPLIRLRSIWQVWKCSSDFTDNGNFSWNSGHENHVIFGVIIHCFVGNDCNFLRRPFIDTTYRNSFDQISVSNWKPAIIEYRRYLNMPSIEGIRINIGPIDYIIELNLYLRTSTFAAVKRKNLLNAVPDVGCRKKSTTLTL